jgi:hypothetical protein
VQIKGFGHGSKLAKYLSAGMDSAFASVVKQLLNTGYPNIVYERAKMTMKSPGSNDGDYLLFPEEMFKGPVVLRMSAPPWMQHLQSQVNAQKDAFAKKLERLEEDPLEEFDRNEGESDADFNKRVIKEKREAVAKLDVEDKTAYMDNAIRNEKKTEKEAEDAWNKQVAKRSDPKNISSLMKKYAEYEFLRARYEQRSCTVSAMWNPYLVPGFPLVILDQRASGYDCIGYLTAVAHNFSARSDGASIGTQINTAFVRTLQEDARDKIMEPLSSVRKVFQNVKNATEFFKAIFYKKTDPGKPVVFQMDDVLETKNKRYQILGPTKAYEDAFENYGTAMNTVARPGCTLREYIEAYHGRDLDSLLADGTVQGENRSFYSVVKDSMPDKKTSGAIYWSRIYKLKQGAGSNPGSKVTNVNDDATSSPGTTGFAPVDSMHGDMAQTRYDWDTTLELYRAILLGKGIGSVPQE